MHMDQYDLIIKNGTVATAADTFDCDVAIKDGKVVTLGTGLKGAARTIDAKGLLVLPGGVDAHVHLCQTGSSGVDTADDFESGTRSAVCGGTTTIISFAAQEKGHSLMTTVEDYHLRAKGKAVSDYSFHLIVADPTERVLREELPELIRQGHTSFKIYLTYERRRVNDRQALDLLALARREGAMMMIHAENHDMIMWLTEQLERAGKSDPKYHAVAHVAIAEREATHRAISLAEVVDVPILIVHVSAGEAIEQIASAQGRGLKVYGETCPQYLFLTEDDLDKPNYEGAKCICSPPPRDKASQELVWRGIQSGVLRIFSSDHAPYLFDGPKGKLKNGRAPFKKIQSGIPGLELRMPLLFSEGVGKGRIDLNTFVSLTATMPAKLYNLYPAKGTIAVGADADIALWDPEKEVTVTHEMLHDNMDFTPYEGMKIKGYPVVTFCRGEIVWENGKFKGAPGHGRFIPRAPSPYAKPAGRNVLPFGTKIDFSPLG
jgi:dihydropyrimidinase